jgi:pyruvate dehydrogenase E2 component (dihydrolipoamide acetyltransferase)
VLKEDVRNAFKERLESLIPATESREEEFTLQAMSPMRKAIASSLVQSKQTIPHFYLTADIDVEALLELRGRMNERLAEGQKKLSVNDFILRAVALALREVPDANVHYSEQGIKRFSSAHVCVAVAIDGGLVTPVIRNAERKGLHAIAAEAATLAEKARERKLGQAELSGGTFTVSNLGMFGIRQFDAVINPPQGAILAVGASRREACEGAEGAVEFRSRMAVTLSCDHRVIDGAVGARFLAVLRELLESPYSLLG